MANDKSIKRKFDISWKALNDMANNGIGHSNLSRIAKKLKEKETNKKKK